VRFFAGFAGRQVGSQVAGENATVFSHPVIKNHQLRAIAHFFRNALAFRFAKQCHASSLNAEFRVSTAKTTEARVPVSAKLPRPSTSASGYVRNL
jgi:hypothetical protein